LLGEQGQRIEGLPELFDPLAAPDERPSESWLDWLAGWLDVVLEEAWPEEKRRGALPEGAALHRIRGTAEGLRRLLYLYTGAPARIEEPFRFARLWALGEASTLGFDTMLAPAHPQGAVVGTTAVLDQSHLIREADYGAPLFEDTAHRFCVLLHAADLRGPGLLEKARQVLEREKPAHTTYHLCLIEPRMRVGFQARVGVDTIVGGPFGDLVLDEPRSLGLDAVLAGRPDRAGKRGTIGRDARIGSRSTMI
jgi:phage tail-like protein